MIAKDMNNRLAALDKAQKARVDVGSILSNRNEVNDDGMVL